MKGLPKNSIFFLFDKKYNKNSNLTELKNNTKFMDDPQIKIHSIFGDQ
jgi:hypothetical protein